MASPIPVSWQHTPPESLVLGDCSYAMALAQILDGGIISSSRMAEGPEELAGHRYPQVLENLARVFLVVPGNMSVAEALRGHESVWRWVAKLAPDGDQHELAFIFVLPPNTFNGFEDALAAGLSLNRILPATTGHAVWRRSAPIQELIETLKSIRPMDLMPLKARRAADGKHSALAKLREATAQREFSAAHEAAREVLAAFSGREYLLDVFCAPPSHQNGNFLRGWLRKAVTEAVPPGAWLTQRQQVAAWLDRDLASPIQ